MRSGSAKMIESSHRAITITDPNKIDAKSGESRCFPFSISLRGYASSNFKRKEELRLIYAHKSFYELGVPTENEMIDRFDTTSRYIHYLKRPGKYRARWKKQVGVGIRKKGRECLVRYS